MSDLNSSLLIIGSENDRGPQPLLDLGALSATHLDDAQPILRQSTFAVVVILSTKSFVTATPSEKLLSFLKELQKISPQSQIVIAGSSEWPNLQTLINEVSLFKIQPQIDIPKLVPIVQQALEEFSLTQQNDQMLQLLHDQNENLKKLSTELEERVEKRQQYLSNSKRRLTETNRKVEALHQALVAIHRATSIVEMETLINEALSEALQLSWTRILFRSQNFLEQQNAMNTSHFEIFSAPLLRRQDMLGQIYFARPQKKIFRKSEHTFLLQIADAVALSIDRLATLEEAETLKQQWETTFDSINKPISLLDDNYQILRCNRAFASKTSLPVEKVTGQTCYKVLFQREKPCSQCRLGQSFRLTPKKTASGESFTYEVGGQTLHFEASSPAIHVMMYNDISEQLRLERQIIESSKMAELGTIGSSIAHELNNPLGGLISFLQLILMDLPKDHSIHQDVQEMELTAKNCKETIQNLLNFSRQPTSDQNALVDLRDVIQRAIKITELQTKSIGINVDFQSPSQAVIFEGHLNLLTQAVRQLLQVSAFRLSDQMRKDHHFVGEIKILTHETETVSVIEVITNLSSQSEEAQEIELAASLGLDLNVAIHIIEEHSGTLEFLQTKEKFLLSRITFPRLENV